MLLKKAPKKIIIQLSLFDSHIDNIQLESRLSYYVFVSIFCMILMSITYINIYIYYVVLHPHVGGGDVKLYVLPK